MAATHLQLKCADGTLGRGGGGGRGRGRGEGEECVQVYIVCVYRS